ncbi:ATP-binding protein [Bergeyella sp. RCAD1439]|uniref:ATP-binding protein n=1 Tax=Bergeyella anatis TaxID=3113737 RepID=UPI002A8A872E|nr:ATP-binding protein [Riemerella anatipestifer]MEC5395969.1 ATP-binding protein [Bergeyella sp. RCAD1439]
MLKEDKQRIIGKVVAINSDRFSVELLSGLDNFNVNGYDDIHYFAQLNSYVIIPYQNYYIVAEVSGVREKDLNVPFSNPTEQILSKIQAGKFLEVIPIGTIKDNQFDFGVSIYPTLYSDVLYIREQELDTIFKTNSNIIKNCQGEENCKKGKCECKNRYISLPIGKSIIFPDYEVKIDIDRFFGSHSAVLGNTGSGKSCTIASMLQTLYKFEEYSATGSTFIFFDVNGEYRQAFEKLDENEDIQVINLSIDSDDDNDSKFKLPHWFLNIDEWALLLRASEKSQLPILRNALGFTQNLSEEVLSHIYACNIMYVYENWESPVAKRQKIKSLVDKAKLNINYSNLSPKFGNFQNENEENDFKDSVTGYIKEDIIIDLKFDSEFFEFKDLEQAIESAILYEEYHGNKQIRDYCSSMITRFKSIKDREDFKFMTESAEDKKVDDYINTLLGIEDDNEAKVKKNQVIIIDLNSANDETVEVISCVLSRLIFEKLKTAKNRNKYPVNLVLEEAHRYISTETGKVFGDANRIFERIAKEGRKYGMFLLVSSQRPSELSKTVLSQCSNFIVHRIQNPEDLSHIRQITPHISETVLKRLPSIPTQHALIFGHSVNLPTTFKVNNANPKPKSDNNDISKNWFKNKGFEVDFI